MRNTLETRLGIFFALALIVAVLILEMVGAFDFFQGGFQVTANFRNVQELKKGDLVKMSGVEIGRVETIDLVTVTNAVPPEATNVALPQVTMASVAKVTMKIRLQFQNSLTTESEAEVKATGLLGQNFVSITPGKGNLLQIAKGEKPNLGATEPTDLNELIVQAKSTLVKISGAADGLSPNNLSGLLGPLNDFIRQNSPLLTAVIGNMKNVSDNMAQGKGTVGKLLQSDEFYVSAYSTITNFQAASTDLKQLMSQAESMITETRQIVSGINAGQGTLGRFAKDDALFVQTTNAMGNLSEILAKINRGYGTVGKLVNDESLYRNAKLSLQKVEKATEGLEDQGPLSVLGIAISTLF